MPTTSKFRYEIIVTNSTGGLAVPVSIFDLTDYLEVEFVITETRENGQFYYIKKVKNKLTVSGVDYTYFIQNFGLCYRYYVKVYKKCEGKEIQIALCYFSDSDFEIDKDKCTIDITLTDSSPYNCIKNKSSQKVDVFSGPAPQNTFLQVTPQLYRSIDFWQAVLVVTSNLNCCDEFGCYFSLISEFFNLQSDGFGGTIFPDTQAMTNYVNPSQPNYYLRLASKSDIKNPTASNPATKLLLSFADVERIMRDVFNVYWVLDGLYLRWEHYSWFSSMVNYDAISATNFPLNKSKNLIKFETSEYPTTESWLYMEANGIDFIGVPIIYQTECTNGEDKKLGFETLTTDTNYIISNPNSIENEGIVLIDCYKVNPTPEYLAWNEIGALSASGFIRNVRLSVANLQRDLFRHGRPLLFGTMNNVYQTFFSRFPFALQENILTELCCQDDYIKWKSKVRTEIGDGLIDEAETNYTTDQIKFKLRHDSI